MKRCKHENASDKYGETTHDFSGDIVYEVEYRECLDCGAWLSLGPSNDDDERVGIEIGAAEIAASGKPPTHDGTRGRGTFTGCAGCGWNAQDRALPLLDDKPSTEAGFLAHAIANHEGEQGTKMFPLCIGTTQLAPTNVQCRRCERYGQRCDWKGKQP